MTAQTQPARPEALQLAIRSMLQEAARQHTRIEELEAELVREAQRTAAEKFRADQMTEQHRMQSAMNAEARGELVQLREKRQPLSDAQIADCAWGYFEDHRNLPDFAEPFVRAIEAAHNITGEPA